MTRKLMPGRIGLALVLAFVLAAAAGATTLIPVTATELTDGAEAIVTGTAVHREVVLSRDGSFPFTYVTFQIHETLKGRVQGQELTLRLHGGELEDRDVVLDGMPRFEIGETYLLFVRNNGRSASPVMGWEQGQMRFGKEARSGETILIDHRNRPVLGLQAGRFTAAKRPLLEPGEIAPGVQVLAEESVQIRATAPGSKAEPVLGARRVLEQLTAFVAERSVTSAFTPGRVVVSASPSEVPVSATRRTVAPLQEVRHD